MVGLHEQAAGRRHGPLLSPARTFKGVAEGALPQHGSYQDLEWTQRGYSTNTCKKRCGSNLRLRTQNFGAASLSNKAERLSQRRDRQELLEQTNNKSKALNMVSRPSRNPLC